MNKNIKIGSYLVGDNEPCFIIAEIGINHNGDGIKIVYQTEKDIIKKLRRVSDF